MHRRGREEVARCKNKLKEGVQIRIRKKRRRRRCMRGEGAGCTERELKGRCESDIS